MAQPLMARLLGRDWERLPPLVRRHYDVAPGSPRAPVLRGIIAELSHHGVGRLVLPVLGWLDVLPGRQGTALACEVCHEAGVDSLHWRRTFSFSGARTSRFDSIMTYLGPGRCLERLRFGLAVTLSVSRRQGAIVFESDGYQWQLGRWRMPLPLGWLVGRVTAIEWQQNGRLAMRLDVEHPWWGRVFGYRGRFEVESGGDRELPSRDRCDSVTGA